MSKLVLTEEYPRQQNLGTALSTFIDRISQFYGGNIKVIDRKPISHSEYFYVEILLFSNGIQLKTTLNRDPETFEITATAHREPNYNYLSKFTDEDFDLLCILAIQRSLKLTTIPGGNNELASHEIEEEKQLSYLIPKLMIVTGQATEANFSR